MNVKPIHASTAVSRSVATSSSESFAKVWRKAQSAKEKFPKWDYGRKIQISARISV